VHSKCDSHHHRIVEQDSSPAYFRERRNLEPYIGFNLTALKNKSERWENSANFGLLPQIVLNSNS
jgi:hypothetical protein